ncbi:MAG: hypothetical protein JST58_06560 [Bacteroidetes bacterium]|nr:hypothetical protein [Bacteroidota bacterium]
MLFRKTACTFILVLSLPIFALSQQWVSGKIYDTTGEIITAAITVQNVSQNKYTISNLEGSYKIPAKEGDLLLFSSSSYLRDSAFVTHFMLNAGYDVSLRERVTTLKAVTVKGLSSFQLDSINRHEGYDPFKKNRLITFDKGNYEKPRDGVGIVFSPHFFLSTKEKQQKELNKRLADEDKDAYVDYKFSKEFVNKLTHLKNDSLNIFLKRYRPSYQFCRSASWQDMLIYVNDSYKKFMKKETPH